MYLERYESKIKEFGLNFNDPIIKMNLLNNLPLNLKIELKKMENNSSNHSNLWGIALSNDTSKLVTKAVGRIVRRSAWRQMSLGTISTPIGKVIKYTLNKISKRFL